MMLKTAGILIGGIFVGAVAVEIVRKSRPGILDKFYADASRMTSGIKAAFKEGYKGVAGRREAEDAPA